MRRTQSCQLAKANSRQYQVMMRRETAGQPPAQLPRLAFPTRNHEAMRLITQPGGTGLNTLAGQRRQRRRA